jgi:nicotinamidase-related amidase
MAGALVVVDVQRDFTPGGALGVEGGDEIIGRINELAASGAFDVVLATRDWHPADHGSFAEHGGRWPRHCVQGTPGAELHPALDRGAIDAVVDKGQDPGTEGYSGFEATGLAELLREEGVTAVTVVGIATDHCVRATALDALKEGFTVAVDASAVRGVDAAASEAALEELRALGAVVAGRPEA